MYVQAAWVMRKRFCLTSSRQACRHRTDCFICPINRDDRQLVMKQVKLCRWVRRLKYRPVGTKVCLSAVWRGTGVSLERASVPLFFQTALPPLRLRAPQRPHRAPLIQPVPLIKITVQHSQPTDQALQVAKEQLHTGRGRALQRAWRRKCVCVCMCVFTHGCMWRWLTVVLVVEIKRNK